MNSEQILETMGEIDGQYIEEAAPAKKKPRKRGWVKWGALAACLCLAAVFLWPDGAGKVQDWSENMEPAAYFKNNQDDGEGAQSDKSLAADAMPYEHSRSFSDQRGSLEGEGVIPSMEDHPLFYGSGYYTRDGTLYYTTFMWQRYGKEDYSTLTVTAAPEEVELPPDCCVVVEIDEKGNVVTPQVTVTQRDGVQIVTQGGWWQEKTMTWQTEQGWYQIVGSFNDSFEDMVMLLDWFWDHPVDFDRFAMERGSVLTFGSRTEYPEAFDGYIPDFASLGYLEGSASVQLKDGLPEHFEGHYYFGAVEEEVDAIVIDYETVTEIHWCVDAAPDYYDREEIMGSLEDLTEEEVIGRVDTEGDFAFLWDDCFVKVYTAGANQAREAWRVISSVQ